MLQRIQIKCPLNNNMKDREKSACITYQLNSTPTDDGHFLFGYKKPNESIQVKLYPNRFLIFVCR